MKKTKIYFVSYLFIKWCESSPSQTFFQKDVFKNFCKFHRKNPVLESLFIKILGQTCNFIKETLTQVFSCEICEIFKNTFFQRTPPVAAFDNN